MLSFIAIALSILLGTGSVTMKCSADQSSGGVSDGTATQSSSNP